MHGTIARSNKTFFSNNYPLVIFAKFYGVTENREGYLKFHIYIYMYI